MEVDGDSSFMEKQYFMEGVQSGLWGRVGRARGLNPRSVRTLAIRDRKPLCSSNLSLPFSGGGALKGGCTRLVMG